MAYAFKKLSELEQLDSVPEGATVLVEADGVILRAPKSEMGGVPKVTTDDAGKFLRVSSDGVWAAETISNAEEASF